MIVSAIAHIACGGNTMSPSSSSSPSASSNTFALSGRITDAATGIGLAGATVSIPSGTNAGQSTTTTSTGAYTLAALLRPRTGIQEIFVVNAFATTYALQTQTINITSTQTDTTLSFALGHSSNTITFGGLTAQSCSGSSPTPPACSVTTYAESGFTVTVASGNWVEQHGYGNPAPFIQFGAAAGTTATGGIRITSGGTPFTFTSVDLYSSTTTIPYQFIGSRAGVAVFTVSNTLGNTFGNFLTVANPNATSVIDTLSIVLTNPAAACCSNPMGLDNIAFSK